VNAFISLHSLKVINSSPSLSHQLQELKIELKKAWDARFSAAFLCKPPPTLKSLLWIVAKSGYTREVAPFMNLSKSTRECKNLQRVMREVRSRGGETQLQFFSSKGMTSSVKRMLEMKSIDVEARRGGEEDGWTCLMTAALYGHLDTCRFLIDKGAQVNDEGQYWLYTASWCC
jgi:ankyrin repeat protein